jgi:hypothetical protein
MLPVAVRQYLELLFLLMLFFFFLSIVHVVREMYFDQCDGNININNATNIEWECSGLDCIDVFALLAFTLFVQRRYNQRNEKRELLQTSLVGLSAHDSDDRSLGIKCTVEARAKDFRGHRLQAARCDTLTAAFSRFGSVEAICFARFLPDLWALSEKYATTSAMLWKVDTHVCSIYACMYMNVWQLHLLERSDKVQFQRAKLEGELALILERMHVIRHRYLDRAKATSSGSIYITFASEAEAQRCLEAKELHLGMDNWRRGRPVAFQLRRAPDPGDILWENLHVPNRPFRYVTVSLFSLLVLFIGIGTFTAISMLRRTEFPPYVYYILLLANAIVVMVAFPRLASWLRPRQRSQRQIHSFLFGCTFMALSSTLVPAILAQGGSHVLQSTVVTDILVTSLVFCLGAFIYSVIAGWVKQCSLCLLLRKKQNLEGVKTASDLKVQVLRRASVAALNLALLGPEEDSLQVFTRALLAWYDRPIFYLAYRYVLLFKIVISWSLWSTTFPISTVYVFGHCFIQFSTEVYSLMRFYKTPQSGGARIMQPVLFFVLPLCVVIKLGVLVYKMYTTTLNIHIILPVQEEIILKSGLIVICAVLFVCALSGMRKLCKACRPLHEYNYTNPRSLSDLQKELSQNNRASLQSPPHSGNNSARSSVDSAEYHLYSEDIPGRVDTVTGTY